MWARYWDYIDEQNPPGPNVVWQTHVLSAGDTVIGGTPCRKLVNTRSRREGPRLDTVLVTTNTAFVYDNTDTVFVYSGNAGKFIPLYIYNVDEGDTVCLSGLFHRGNDSTFAISVDSIRMTLYDTGHLKTYYTHTLMEYAGIRLTGVSLIRMALTEPGSTRDNIPKSWALRCLR